MYGSSKNSSKYYKCKFIYWNSWKQEIMEWRVYIVQWNFHALSLLLQSKIIKNHYYFNQIFLLFDIIQNIINHNCWNVACCCFVFVLFVWFVCKWSLNYFWRKLLAILRIFLCLRWCFRVFLVGCQNHKWFQLQFQYRVSVSVRVSSC